MGRSGTLFLAAGLAFAPVWAAVAQESESADFWDGFYLGILGGARTETALVSRPVGSLGVTAGAGQLTNESFYYGAEAFLAAQSLSGGDNPFLWLEADGRLGARVTAQMLLY